MNRPKSVENDSDSDRTSFDFKYKIEISQRKGMTGETFKQSQEFDFDDFKDIGEARSQLSILTSNRRILPSELIKREDDSIAENMTESYSIRKGSHSGDLFKRVITEEEEGDAINENQIFSPKFMDDKMYKTVTNKRNLKHSENLLEKSKLKVKFSVNEVLKNISNASSPKSSKDSPNKLKENSHVFKISTSRNRIKENSIPVEDQFKDYLSSIQFYESELAKTDYETQLILEEIEKYSNLNKNNQALEEEAKSISQETTNINAVITDQRSLERTLVQEKERLETHYQELSHSIESLRFERPTKVTHEFEQIVNEINFLKEELEALNRETGSLKLSAVSDELMNPPSLREQRISFTQEQLFDQKSSFNPEKIIMQQFSSEVSILGEKYPHYVYNLKMMIVKEEWKIFENAEICINCSYREYPFLQIKIGNKTTKHLSRFKLMEGVSIVLEKEFLQSKSYYVHQYKMTKLSQPFLKVEISYGIHSEASNNEEAKVFIFYLPTLPLKHGEFIPFNKKELEASLKTAKIEESEFVIPFKPLDSLIIKEKLSELRLYYPNLIYENDMKNEEAICLGVFQMWSSGISSIISIRQKGSSVSVCVKNGVPFLAEALMFFLSSCI